MRQPREWWINPAINKTCLIEPVNNDMIPFEHSVTVIEKSAYDALKAELEKLTGDTSLWNSKPYIQQLRDELEQAKAEIERLKQQDHNALVAAFLEEMHK